MSSATAIDALLVGNGGLGRGGGGRSMKGGEGGGGGGDDVSMDRTSRATRASTRTQERASPPQSERNGVQ
jgi:hypothetical protein